MKKFFFKNKYTILLIALPVVLFFVFHDFSSYPKSLDPIFKMAGKNQSELKRVIRHYSWFASDSLKRRAAIFLIENMDAHYSYQSDEWDKFQVELDSLFKKELNNDKLKPAFDSISKKYNLFDVRYISDLHTVNAKFLILNIDEAFKAWQSPYAKHLSFDDFCEYILPYRVGKEPLSDWRKEFDNHYFPDMFARMQAKIQAKIKKEPIIVPIPVPYRTSEVSYNNWYTELKKNNFDLNLFPSITEIKDSVIARGICDALKTPPGAMTFMPQDMPDYSAHTLSILRLGSCKHYAQQAVLAARRLGVPVVLDITPQWAIRSFSHEWNALIYKKKTPLAFGFGDRMEIGKHIEIGTDRIAPKVYRLTFAKQPTSLAQIHGREEIPAKLALVCMKDVTKDYYQTIDVPVKLLTLPPNGNKFAYLSVFDNKDWIPVAWSKINKRDVLFEGLNKNIVCLPSYYHKGVAIPAAYPVVLRTDCTITTLKPDLQHRETVVLNRKYQGRMSAWLAPCMIGGRFQVSNDSNFTKAVDIYVKKDVAEPYFQIEKIHQKGKYKYFRYIHPHGDVAEIEVCEPGSLVRLTGRAIGNCQPLPGSQYANAFDGDVLTQFLTDDAREDTWVGLVFDKPRRIGRIAYLRRNDGNCICNGELYELFYWDNKWISLGQQTGSNKTYRLTYRNVPTNALLLLRDLTKGAEERIFTYEKGEQVWW